MMPHFVLAGYRSVGDIFSHTNSRNAQSWYPTWLYRTGASWTGLSDIPERASGASLCLQRFVLPLRSFLTSRARQQELEAELYRLKKAVEQSPVTAVIAERTGAIQYVNPAFSATSGYSAEEALGQNPR